MADKIFDPSNPTPNTSAASATPATDSVPAVATETMPGATGDLQPAVAAKPTTFAPDHVASTNDASLAASGAIPAGTHPAWPNGQAPTHIETANDPNIVGTKSDVVGLTFETWRHVSGKARDQIAGFAHWISSRHGNKRLTSDQWEALLSKHQSTNIK